MEELQKKSGIYFIKNLKNGKLYIGQSVDIRDRITHHKYHLKANKHSNEHLQRSYNKAGINNFEFKALEYCDEEQRDEREVYWIHFYKSNTKKYGYNIESGGHANKKLSEEAKLKMSKARKGRKMPPRTEEHIRKLADAHIGHKHSKDSKQKMSESRKGKKLSEYQKQCLLNSRIGSKHSEETKRKWSEQRKGKTLTEDHKRKMSEGMKGKNTYLRSEETKKRMSESMKGSKKRPQSEEHKRKRAESRIGKPLSEETRRKISEAIKANNLKNKINGGKQQ